MRWNRKTAQPEKPSFYPQPLYRWLMAIPAAHFIVTYNQKKEILVIMSQTNYWLAMAVSIIAGFLLISTVTAISVQLDRNYNWEVFTLRRSALQLLLGLALPLLLDILLIWGFFVCFHHDFWKSRFMKQELKLVFLLLLALNLLYVSFYFADALKRHKKLSQVRIPATLGKKKIAVAPKEVAYVYRQDHYGYVFCKNGHCYNTECSMAKLKDLLPEQLFVQTRRSLMVSLDAIESYTTYGNSQGRITLKYKSNEDFNDVISREYYAAFKNKWQEYLNQNV